MEFYSLIILAALIYASFRAGVASTRHGCSHAWSKWEEVRYKQPAQRRSCEKCGFIQVTKL